MDPQTDQPGGHFLHVQPVVRLNVYNFFDMNFAGGIDNTHGLLLMRMRRKLLPVLRFVKKQRTEFVVNTTDYQNLHITSDNIDDYKNCRPVMVHQIYDFTSEITQIQSLIT
ncbi:MAG: hypothetical protein CME31_06915 [Gimesia sp.]|uniref:Uncharacterized protein n=1 Tax=Gimesia maris TaxID=122 RepID=A0A3D3R1B4_9PLAN|nr:hypothetical protein [Gimesia sp.]HCO21747.1 hypothetical protein [Gimesia maris]